MCSTRKSRRAAKRFARFQGRDGVEFHAIAGGKNHASLTRPDRAEMQRRGMYGLGESEPFAHRDGRGMVAEADDNQRHFDYDFRLRFGNGRRS